METDTKAAVETKYPQGAGFVDRIVRLFWAHLRCDWYLLTRGMWRGECKFCGWDKNDGRMSYIAATTGSIWDNSIKVQRVFWNEYVPNTH